MILESKSLYKKQFIVQSEGSNNASFYLGKPTTISRRYMFKTFTVKQLMLYHIHLGGDVRDIVGTSYWFLYARKENFIYLNLWPTIVALRRTVVLLRRVLMARGKLLYVNQDPLTFWDAMDIAIDTAEAFCVYYWMSGTLTNFKKIWPYFITVLNNTPWEQLREPKVRLKFCLHGLSLLTGPPSLIFINHLKYSAKVADESNAVRIPSFGLVDVDTNSGDTAFLIPSNDESITSVNYFNDLFGKLTMLVKIERTKQFMLTKFKRKTQFWRTRLAVFRHRLFNLLSARTTLERLHTKNHKVSLPEWTALRRVRRETGGFFVSSFFTKDAESYIFRRLKRERYHLKGLLNTIAGLEYRIFFYYNTYFKQFFFKARSNRITMKYSLKLNILIKRLLWLYKLKSSFVRLKAWAKERSALLRSSVKATSSPRDLRRLKKFNLFVKIISLQTFRLLKFYDYFINRYAMPLQSTLKEWRQNKLRKLHFSRIISKKMKSLDKKFIPNSKPLTFKKSTFNVVNSGVSLNLDKNRLSVGYSDNRYNNNRYNNNRYNNNRYNDNSLNDSRFNDSRFTDSRFTDSRFTDKKYNNNRYNNNRFNNNRYNNFNKYGNNNNKYNNFNKYGNNNRYNKFNKYGANNRYNKFNKYGNNNRYDKFNKYGNNNRYNRYNKYNKYNKKFNKYNISKKKRFALWFAKQQEYTKDRYIRHHLNFRILDLLNYKKYKQHKGYMWYNYNNNFAFNTGKYFVILNKYIKGVNIFNSKTGKWSKKLNKRAAKPLRYPLFVAAFKPYSRIYDASRPWMVARRPKYFVLFPENFKQFSLNYNLMKKFISKNILNFQNSFFNKHKKAVIGFNKIFFKNYFIKNTLIQSSVKTDNFQLFPRKSADILVPQADTTFYRPVSFLLFYPESLRVYFSYIYSKVHKRRIFKKKYKNIISVGKLNKTFYKYDRWNKIRRGLLVIRKYPPFFIQSATKFWHRLIDRLWGLDSLNFNGGISFLKFNLYAKKYRRSLFKRKSNRLYINWVSNLLNTAACNLTLSKSFINLFKYSDFLFSASVDSVRVEAAREYLKAFSLNKRFLSTPLAFASILRGKLYFKLKSTPEQILKRKLKAQKLLKLRLIRRKAVLKLKTLIKNLELKRKKLKVRSLKILLLKFKVLPKNLLKLYISRLVLDKKILKKLNKLKSKLRYYNLIKRNLRKFRLLSYNRLLNKAFPYHTWLNWYGRYAGRLNSFFYKQIIFVFVRQFNYVLQNFRRTKLFVQRNLILSKFFIFVKICFMQLFLKTGEVFLFKILQKIFKIVSFFSNIALTSKSFFDVKNFKHVFAILKRYKVRNLSKIYQRKRKKKWNLSFLLRFFYKNQASVYLIPKQVSLVKDKTLNNLYFNNYRFFGRHLFTFLKQDVMKKFGSFYGWAFKEKYMESHIYDDMYARNFKEAQRFELIARSKFNRSRTNVYSLKAEARLEGKIFLDYIINSVRYGRFSPRTDVEGAFLREIIHRWSAFQKRKFIVFKEMFQNNMLVDRPHLKADVSKFKHPKMYLLRNFGIKRFNKQTKEDTLEMISFMKWAFHGSRVKYIPNKYRRKFRYFVKLWTNKSINMIF